ncbi:WAS/WASL-interacting protein family member 1-like isoform X2 [Venturia canescens]|uniref:WAS/WASL-interacting protein family member 1-like isoform X2 n=1 Tax=Venturia canescens TaxID=32260 RepID=UPI001C9CDB1F|nr:WAS/WASL-interacting protein family member 1-like isoform X2 [Venturia canescens]
MSSTGSSTLVLGGSAGDPSGSLEGTTGFCPAPPPPPPPPPLPSSTSGRVPAPPRINALETAVPTRRRPLSNDFGNNDAYEPPAAIQNAMMTRDKKPFTYTPGMGGKLDLSQIRSPRMARRVAKNANDEGIEAPQRSTASESSVSPAVAASSMYAAQPRVAVPVFPSNAPPVPLRSTLASSSLPPTSISAGAANNNRLPSSAETKPATPARTGQTVVVTPTWSQPSPPSPPSTPTTPTTPPSPQISLAKAPTPWLQNRNKSQQGELPEWAKRSQPSTPSSPPEQEPSHSLRERIIPLRIEERPSVFSVDNDAAGQRQRLNNQQAQQPSTRHQQRWGGATPPSPVDAHNSAAPQKRFSAPANPSSGGTYIVPIMLEGSAGDSNNNATVERRSPRVIIQRGPGAPPSPQSAIQNQYQDSESPAPVQSRSFRVLQKITDTDAPIDRVDGQQSRKLRLTENDKVLMNKVKERVDGEGTYLHQEEDPRYRGAAIPSRAFRYLRNMTDAGDPSIPVATTASGVTGPVNKMRQMRNSPPPDEFRVIVPASEQQAPEPKKYTGGAIPSRSFRMLQAMTSPESIGPDQTDY